jgi:hypothetical protein
MAKTKPKLKAKTPEILDTVKPGEMFIRTTYIRLKWQKHGIPESEASKLFDAELESGSIVVSHEWSGIKIYKKT